MLTLDDPRWGTLDTDYGKADVVPEWISALRSGASPADHRQVWFEFWSALAHQGDVYSGSFAAVPHIVDMLAADPTTADVACCHFPAWVEICRSRHDIEVPAFLAESYFSALARMPTLIGSAAREQWNGDRMRCALAAVAAATGHTGVAEVILELDDATAGETLNWLESR